MKLFSLLLFFVFFQISAQFKYLGDLNSKMDKQSFMQINRPSVNNKLARFLKQNMTPAEVYSLKFQNNGLNFGNIVRAKFEVGEDGIPWNIHFNSGTLALNNKVIKLLKSYLIQNIPNLNKLHQGEHYMQLFSKENDKVLIKPSSVIVSDFPPVLFQECTNSPSSDVYDCFKDNLKNLIISNLDNDLIVKEKIVGELRFHIGFKLDKLGSVNNLKIDVYSPNIYRNGVLYDLKSTSYSDTIERRIKESLSVLSKTKLAPTNRNGIPYETEINETMSIFIGEYLNKEKISELRKTKFTQFLKSEISDKLIQSEPFLAEVPVIKVFFIHNEERELDKVWTNAYNSNVNKKLIKAFKKFSQGNIKREKGKIYFQSVLRKVNNKKMILADDDISYISIGTYKDCVSCETYLDFLKGNIIDISMDIVNGFNKLEIPFKIGFDKEIYLGGGRTKNLLTTGVDDSSYGKKPQQSFNLFRYGGSQVVQRLPVSDMPVVSKKRTLLSTQTKDHFWGSITREKWSIKQKDLEKIRAKGEAKFERPDEINLKLVVNKQGKIKVKAIKIKDFYNKTNLSKLSSNKVNLIYHNIEKIVDKLSAFKKLTQLDNNFKGMEIGIFSFMLIE